MATTEIDPDATGEGARRARRSPTRRPKDPGADSPPGNQRSQEEWRIRAARHRPVGARGRKARIGRNPATGESIKIPAKKVVKFRVAKAAKDAIVPPKKAK